MKRVYLIGGPMGVGKTTVCRELQKRLYRSVFLDGDWCWDANPFQVTEETKAMVTENICFLLNNFLRCSAYDHVIFCWVLHQQGILDGLLSRLDVRDCRVQAVSLIASPEALAASPDAGTMGKTCMVLGTCLARLTNSLYTTTISSRSSLRNLLMSVVLSE